MICPKCNNETNGDNFCTKCGANLNVNNTNNMWSTNNGNLTRVNIIREKHFVGCIINFPVYINDNKLGDLKNGETISCDLGVGKYVVTFNMFEKKVMQEINITGSNSSVDIICTAKFGFLTAVVKVKDVIYK